MKGNKIVSVMTDSHNASSIELLEKARKEKI
jgi:hypothetical protein